VQSDPHQPLRDDVRTLGEVLGRVLRHHEGDELFEHVERVREAAKRARVPVQFKRIGSMFCAYFNHCPVDNLSDALQSDRARFAKFFHGMLAENIYLAPSQFEAGFISAAHSDDEIDRTVSAAAKVLRTL
jgi:glutamate-1-semialdehyde 2,1-aminomutase